MNNSYLVGTGKCLGYCSVLPPIGESHMFGDTEVKFAYNVGENLFFESHENDGELTDSEIIEITEEAECFYCQGSGKDEIDEMGVCKPCHGKGFA